MSLYQSQKDDGSFTCGIDIQVNLPGGGNEEGYRLHGFLEANEDVTLEIIRDSIATAFGIKPDDPVWETEEL